MLGKKNTRLRGEEKTRLGKKNFFGVENLEILLKRFFRTVVYRTLSSSFHIFIFHS
jgi:hypothetical protein